MCRCASVSLGILRGCVPQLCRMTFRELRTVPNMRPPADCRRAQLRRMFDELIIGASPPPVASGYPLFTIGEKIEVLCKPKIMPIKSLTLEKIEDMEAQAARQSSIPATAMKQ